MSLLTIIQDAMTLAGLNPPSSVVANSDPTVRQFLAVSQEEGDELARFHAWSSLKRLAVMNGDGSATYFQLAPDFQRFMEGDQVFINTFRQPLRRVSDDDMARIKQSLVTLAVPVWRLFMRAVEVYPAPAAGAVLTTEYRSRYWVASSDLTTTRDRWANDDDVPLMPERLFTLGIRWRWRKTQGLDYAEDFRSYQIERGQEVAADSPRQTIVVRERMVNPLTSGDTTGLIPPVIP